MSKSKLLTAAMIVALSGSAQAQNITAGATLTGIASQGAFHSQVDQAYGLGANVSYTQGIVALRADFNWLNHGWENRAVQSMDLNTSNDMFFLQAGPEVSVKVGQLRPYLGAKAGLAYFVTSASTRREQQNLEVWTMVEQHDAVFAYSAQAGVRIPVLSVKQISLDVGTSYQRSDEAVILAKGSVDVNDDGTFSLNATRGKAKFWGFHVGASIPIAKKK